MLRLFFSLVLFGTCWVAGTAGLCAPLHGHLQARGPELVLSLGDGRTLEQEALVGVLLVLGDVQVRIDGVDMAAATVGGPIPLYDLSVVGSDPEPRNYCLPDLSGRRAAIVLPKESGSFRLTCTSGAEGKCILFGYRPWEGRRDLPMHDLHQACIHMLRADYGGDGSPTTKDGTLVDIYDRFDIQKADRVPGTEFEAAWGPDGAICVAHPRIEENMTLEEIRRRYPHLAERLGPRACTEDLMRHDRRALIFNRSAVTHRASTPAAR